MKTLRILLSSVLITAVAVAAAPNAYDTLAKLLMPFVGLIAQNAKSGNRALVMTLQVEPATSTPKELIGAQAQLFFQYPDKLKVTGPVLGENVTVWRNGQELWAAPGEKIQAILDANAAKLPKPNPKFKLAPFQLPIPEKQLVFLPALFRVQAAGTEQVGSDVCQVLDVQLMPELQRSLKDAQGWSARVWVTPEQKPARLVLTGPDSGAAVRFTEVQFSKTLPKETFTPKEEDGAVKIPAGRYDQLIRALLERS